MSDTLHQELKAALISDDPLPEPLPEPLRLRIIAALDLAEREWSLDAGFGLSATWWRTAARRRRDALIVEARELLPATLTLRKAGEEIARIARNIQSRHHGAPAQGPAAPIKLALETGITFPDSGRQVSNILTADRKSV